MAIVTFAPAVRLGTHVIITAYGFSGCGKTLSLLLLGRGLVGPKGRLALIDTETGRGKIYAKRIPGGYDYAQLTAPFTPERYGEAIEAAEAAGVEALVLDSGSHEWEGIGGVLEMADAGESRSGKPLEGLIKWAKPKAAHKRYVSRLLNSHMHLLISLRAKEKMRQLTAQDALPVGKKIGDIVSDGQIPIQDKRFVYETTVQLYLPLGRREQLGVPEIEKCPEDLLGAFPDGARISEETGRKIGEWVSGGEPVDHAAASLMREAEEAASQGADALRNFWRRLSKADQSRIRPMADNLGSIARTADEEAEQRQRDQTEGHKTFRPAADPDDDLDAFGLKPITEAASPAAEPAIDPAPTDPSSPRARTEAFWSQDELRVTGTTPREVEYEIKLYLAECRDQLDVNGIESANGPLIEKLPRSTREDVQAAITRRRNELPMVAK